MGAAAANGGGGDPAGPCARQHLGAATGKTASWEQTIKVVGDKTKDAFGVGEEEEEEGGGEEGSEEHTDDGVGKSQGVSEDPRSNSHEGQNTPLSILLIRGSVAARCPPSSSLTQTSAERIYPPPHRGSKASNRRRSSSKL